MEIRLPVTGFLTGGLVAGVVAAILLAPACCLAPLGATLPDGTPTPAGFAGLAIPMHTVAGIWTAFVTPRLVQR